jgi:hypothetical protein
MLLVAAAVRYTIAGSESYVEAVNSSLIGAMTGAVVERAKEGVLFGWGLFQSIAGQ